MGQLPPIFKEISDPDAPLHLGAVLGGCEPLCGSRPENEMDLIGWVSTRGWSPNERFCPECAERYRRGRAWNPPSAGE